MNFFGKWSNLPFFTQEWSQGGEKCGFIYASAEYYLQPNTVKWHCTWVNHYYFVCSYLQVMWWAFGQWKGRTIYLHWMIMIFSDKITCWVAWEKQPTFHDATTGFHVKLCWEMWTKFLLVRFHHPVPCIASDWLCYNKKNLVQPITSTS